MSTKPRKRATSTMTRSQRECLLLLQAAFDDAGTHVTKNAHPFGTGIKCTVPRGILSTVCPDFLTRLVVLAHDFKVRAAIIPAGGLHLAIFLSHTTSGGGRFSRKRYPVIERAITAIRQEVYDD